MSPPPSNSAWFRRLAVLLLRTAILLAIVYVIVRTVILLAAGYGWVDKTAAVFLLLAEIFILIHGIGYFLQIIQVLRTPPAPDPALPPGAPPPVAVLVPSYAEPLDVLESTLVCLANLTYPAKQPVLLDDTRYDRPGPNGLDLTAYRRDLDALCARLGIQVFRRPWRGAKAGIVNDFLAYVDGRPPAGSSLETFGTPLPAGPPRYLAVFDADQNPFPHFLERLVARMEADPRLAFIQTPQYYTNTDTNRVARAAALQQVVFYEYICEAKGLSHTNICCGTNVILRREALLDVGGFDEGSVTEDFATTIRFTRRGWGSHYDPRACAFGMGPEDLGAYFKQQFRWALGTLGILRRLLADLVLRPGSLSAAAWWEYLLSSSYYLIGFVFLVLVLCPVLYLFLNVPSYFANPELYALFFIPYFLMALLLFFWTLGQRHYRSRDLFLGQMLIAISFPVYVRAAFLALLGRRGRFVVTPKAGGSALPLRDLWPQLLLAALVFAAIVWGLNRLLYETDNQGALLVNLGWSVYHATILSFTLYFNRPESEPAGGKP